jgi:hypothetical protein
MEEDQPARRRIVVDGSNIATEGRNLPSLAQLDEAIRSFLEEYRGFTTSDVTVVVDASFGHRIDPSELDTFEQALEHGEMITPPAGAVGRGDGFILRIAEKSGALVLSNDSFQEFHAERPWLFDPGRLIGGKPVPGVGWIFTPRTPVRGARSRSVTSRSRRVSQADDGDSSLVSADSDDSLATVGADGVRPLRGAKTAKAAKAATTAKAAKAAKTSKTAKATKANSAVETTKVAKAVKAVKTTKAAKASKGKATKAPRAPKSVLGAEPAEATTALKAAKAPAKAARAGKASANKLSADATTTKGTKKRAATTSEDGPGDSGPSASKRSGGTHDRGGDDQSVKAPDALNDPMTFLTFVADHPVGSTLDGTVVSFTSHGAHIDVGGMLCHVPLRGLGVPAPKRARQVLAKGETRQFVLVSLDAARRRAELALPGIPE